MLCLHCLTDIPEVFIENNEFNEVHRRLASTDIPLNKAVSWFYYYRDTPFAHLIQRAKYNNRPLIVRKLARIYASSLTSSGFFSDIHFIVPVPISTLKRLYRGYNQTMEIARGIADITHIPVIDILRVRHHSSQTRRNRYQRWLNARSIYSLSSGLQLDNSHILLVDDVITSGATMLACLNVIRSHFPHARLSVLSLALAAGN